MLDQVLKERDLLPVLQHENGTAVTPETWQQRRREMLKALETYSYGVTPTVPVTVKGEVAMRILLHLAALGALAAAEAAALQHGGIEGVGDLTLLTLALQSQGDHLIQQLGILHTHRLPQIEAEAAGDGVDLV